MNLTTAGMPLAETVEAAGITTSSGGSGFPAPSDRRAGNEQSPPPGGNPDQAPPSLVAIYS